MKVETSKLVLAGFVDRESIAEPLIRFTSGDKLGRAEGVTGIPLTLRKGRSD